MTRPTLSINKAALKKSRAAKQQLEISTRTPSKAKKMRRKQQELMIEFLGRHYPLVFNLDEPLPLKIGILKDLIRITICYGFSAMDTRRAIYFWTNRFEYHACVANGEYRFDLDGAHHSLITDEHKSHSKVTVANTLRNKKKKQQGSKKRK